MCVRCLWLFLYSFFVMFESLESFISIFLNLYIWMSRRMNQTYFECYEFDLNVVLILIVTCSYRSMLNRVRMNQSNWIAILLTHSYAKLHEYLWVPKKKKTIHCWSLIPIHLRFKISSKKKSKVFKIARSR